MDRACIGGPPVAVTLAASLQPDVNTPTNRCRAMLDWMTNPAFMPHGYCLLWHPALLWTHVVSDGLIALAYFSIPGMILYYLRKRTAIADIPGIYLAVGLMFACFIVFCGITHVLGLVTIWLPWYGIEGISKLATALVSVATALACIPILPKALSLRSAEELEQINQSLESEIQQREARERELDQRNRQLQAQIEARTRAEQGEQEALQEKTELERTLRELRAAQARLVESEKLASLGKAMAGIAHEVNTPVGIAVTATSALSGEVAQIEQALKEHSLTESDLQAFLDTARESAKLSETSLHRAAGLLQSVKQVATDQSNDEHRAVELNAYLKLVLDSIKPKYFASRREVKLDCPDELTVECIPGALSQVVSNLVINALTHAYGPDDEGDVELRVSVQESDVVLECEDHGRGIPEGLQQKIFEPFFTTRAGDGGSGIGLDLVHTSVTEKLKGSIQLRSGPGAGSLFTVRFPIGAPEH